MSMKTVFRAISRHTIGRAPAGAGAAAEHQAAIGRHRDGTAETVFATDLPVCRGTRTEVVTASAAAASTATMIAAEFARAQNRARKEGAWLDYGRR